MHNGAPIQRENRRIYVGNVPIGTMKAPPSPSVAMTQHTRTTDVGSDG